MASLAVQARYQSDSTTITHPDSTPPLIQQHLTTSFYNLSRQRRQQPIPTLDDQPLGRQRPHSIVQRSLKHEQHSDKPSVQQAQDELIAFSKSASTKLTTARGGPLPSQSRRGRRSSSSDMDNPDGSDLDPLWHNLEWYVMTFQYIRSHIS